MTVYLDLDDLLLVAGRAVGDEVVVSASEDDRFDLMIVVASGAIDDVDAIAAQLRQWCR